MIDPLSYRIVRNVCKSHRLACAIYSSLCEMKADLSYLESKSKANPKYLPLLITVQNDLTHCTQMLKHTVDMN